MSDAVVRVLEDKDISVTVALLELLTPAQVASECSHLERLCITQQLAADMSVNVPIEVRYNYINLLSFLIFNFYDVCKVPFVICGLNYF